MDIGNAIGLQKKYLTHFNYENIFYYTYEDFEILNEDYDFCFSAYGVGEFARDIQQFYIDNIIS